ASWGLRSLAAAIYEGCVVQHGAEGPAPSRGSASNAHPGRGNVDRWRPGGLQSLAAAIYEGCIVQHGAEGPAPSRDRPAMPIRAAAMLIGGGLEGCGPSQPPSTKTASFSTAPRDRRPPWGSASNGLHSSSLQARTAPWQAMNTLCQRVFISFSISSSRAAILESNERKRRREEVDSGILEADHIVPNWHARSHGERLG